jgi:hypothetical protein
LIDWVSSSSGKGASGYPSSPPPLVFEMVIPVGLVGFVVEEDVPTLVDVVDVPVLVLPGRVDAPPVTLPGEFGMLVPMMVCSGDFVGMVTVEPTGVVGAVVLPVPPSDGMVPITRLFPGPR